MGILAWQHTVALASPLSGRRDAWARNPGVDDGALAEPPASGRSGHDRGAIAPGPRVCREA
jgi:hypothetical protein